MLSGRAVQLASALAAWAIAALPAPAASAECPGRGTELTRPIWADGGDTVLGAVEVDCRAIGIQAFAGDSAHPMWAIRLDELERPPDLPAIESVDELLATDTTRFLVLRAAGSLLAIDRRELVLRRLTPPGAALEGVSLSPDGLRVAYLRSGLPHRFDLATGVETPLMKRERDSLLPLDGVAELAWAPHGFGLALIATLDGRMRLGFDDLSNGEVQWARDGEPGAAARLGRLGWDAGGSRAFVERSAGESTEALVCDSARFHCRVAARRAAGASGWPPRELARDALLWLAADGSGGIAVHDRLGRERARFADRDGRRLRPIVVREAADLLIALAESSDPGATRDQLVRFSLASGTPTLVATVDRATARFHPNVLAWIEAEASPSGAARWRRFAIGDRKSDELVPRLPPPRPPHRPAG